MFSLRLLGHARRGQNVTAVQTGMDLILRNRNRTRCGSEQDAQRAQRAGGATACWHTSWCRKHGMAWQALADREAGLRVRVFSNMLAHQPFFRRGMAWQALADREAGLGV